ncbi:hypothetical protein QBC43DRAFT_307910 [Cladorrhinum sp. PSN259]|nr:hypothetical protein QBC43DRAFT_307910 [Cladorrhinum sp. PSN259]
MPRPRPKRSRPGASRSEAPAATKPIEHHHSSPSPPLVTKPNLTQSTLPPDALSDPYDVSDREKELRKQRVATRRSQADVDVNLNSQQNKALEHARKRRDDAMDRLENITSTSAIQPNESPDIEHSRRDSVTMTDAHRPPRLTEVSGLDLDDDVFGNLDDSLDDAEHAIDDTRDGHTRSTDTSSFNIAAFKRRPRQSSVAGRDDAPIRPSSRGQMTPSISTTLNFRGFKRRAREPSILGTARKDRSYRSASRGSQASRNAEILGDRDDEDSGPDGESTPVDTRRRSRRSRDAATTTLESPTQPSRKRKSLEAHEVGREKRAAVEVERDLEEAEDASPEEVIESIEEDNQPPVSSPLSSPPIKRWLDQDRPSTPGQDDPDMAPPMSDSASQGESPIAWPPIDTLAQRRYVARPPPPQRVHKTPELGNDLDSNISSPPSLTHSPNYRPSHKAKPAAKKKAPAPVPKPTTDVLASLLPQRRSKRFAKKRTADDPFDIDESEDDVDNSELPVASKSRSASAAKKKQQKQALSKSASSNRKGKEKAVVPSSGKNPKVRTYGSRVSDKENDGEEIVVGSGDENVDDEDEPMADGDDADESQLHLEQFGEELHNAAKKFKEVDKYELTFETVEPRSSSLGPDAR